MDISFSETGRSDRYDRLVVPMFDAVALFWLLLGGLLEPVWLIALKKSENFKRKGYGVLAIIVIVASPLCLSFAMKSIPMGIAYAVWTGIGAVCAIWFGALLFKEKITPRTAVYVCMIIVGAVGLSLLEAS